MDPKKPQSNTTQSKQARASRPYFFATTFLVVFGLVVVVPFIFLVPAPTLPGLLSTLPTIFSAAPSTLALTELFFAGFLVVAFLTPAPVFARGLEVLAFALVDFLVVVLRVGSVETVSKTRGLELPVVLRVPAIATGVCWARWFGRSLKSTLSVSATLTPLVVEMGRKNSPARRGQQAHKDYHSREARPHIGDRV